MKFEIQMKWWYKYVQVYGNQNFKGTCQVQANATESICSQHRSLVQCCHCEQ